MESVVLIQQAIGIEFHFETCEARIPEDVIVTNDAADKERSIAIFHGLKLIFRQRVCQADVDGKFALASYGASRASGAFDFDILWRVVFGANLHSELNQDVLGRGLPDVLKFHGNGGLLARFEVVNHGASGVDVGPKLALGSFIRASYETYGSRPQHEGDNRKQPFARLNPKDFRSVIAAMFTLLFATWIYLRGWTVLGWIVAAYAIFGLMLRLDLWSLAIWIMRRP